MKKNTLEDVAARFCFAVMLFFMATICVRFLTRQILIDGLSMDNALTRLVFFDNQEAGVRWTEEADAETVTVDWQERYPFRKQDLALDQTVEKKEQSRLEQYQETAFALEEKVEVYTGELLAGYMQAVEGMNWLEKKLGWEISSYAEYNGVIELQDGHLTACCEKIDTTQNAESVKELYEFCTGSGRDFLYVQTPYKISPDQDAGISGTLDYSSQNADELLDKMRKAQIPCLDLRERIREEGAEPHSLFYRTDHHWKVETGLWAAGVIAEVLDEDHGFSIDRTRLQPEQFVYRTYPDWFLGSYGKKVTLTRTTPDDFTEIYPKYETSFTYEMPGTGRMQEGDFSVLYDREQIVRKDYYNADPYLAYLYGGGPVIHIRNRQVQGGKILFIKDSFAISVIPFLALGVEETDVLDVREFDGSAKAFIEECDPDMVIVLYNAGSIREIDWPSHLSAFDFR